jgi:hypothetical protein
VFHSITDPCGPALHCLGRAVRGDDAVDSFRNKAIAYGIVAWIIIGFIAAAQRGYINTSPHKTCQQAYTIAETMLAGPMNYWGITPNVTSCHTPEPSTTTS